MTFIERKKDNGYEYEVDDVFGYVKIETKERLTPEMADAIVGSIISQNITSLEIKGTVKTADGNVGYYFKKRPMWEEDDETDVK